MNAEIIGAFIGGGAALIGVLFTLSIQTRREDRHRFTVHRQEAYSRFYLLSNVATRQIDSIRNHLQVEPPSNTVKTVRSASGSGSRYTTLMRRLAETRNRRGRVKLRTDGKLDAGGSAETWLKRSIAMATELEGTQQEMSTLQSSFAIMSPYQLRAAARRIQNDLLQLLAHAGSFAAEEDMKRAEKQLMDSQVRFVNLARKDLGVSPRWRGGITSDGTFTEVQTAYVTGRDAKESRQAGAQGGPSIQSGD